MPSFQLSDLTSLFRAIGRASVFYSPGAFQFNATGTNLTLTHLGDTEGPIEPVANTEYMDLTLPELTGPAIHQRYVTGESPQVQMSLLVADPDVLDILSPVGSASGGYWRRRKVTEYTLVIFPEDLFLESNQQVSVSYDKVNGWKVGADAATPEQERLLDLSIWFWRGHFDRALPVYRHEDGGKALRQVTFQALWNPTMPDGDRLFTVGRPDQRPTPIHISAT